MTQGEGVLHQIVGTQSDLRFAKMRGQNDVKSMKKGVNWIENQDENWYKMLKICYIIHLGEKNRPTLGPSISETKCDRDKPSFSAERGGQSDCVEV